MSLKHWFSTCDHTNIGSLYISIGVWRAGVGGGLSLLIRKEIRSKGSFLGSDQFYYSIVTAHAFIIVFFVVIPVLGAGLGNWLLPFFRLNKDIALPRINALRFWTVLPAITIIVSSLNTDGGRGTGWTVYPPLSGEGHRGFRVDIAILSLHLAGASSLIGAINFSTTMHSRTGGLQILTLSVFSWCVGTIRALLIISLPVLAGAVTLLLFDRNARASFYVFRGGGDPVLFQHLFWFLGHPEVYILILPGLGVVTHAVMWGTGSRSVYGRASLVVAVRTIGVIGCLVWAHHIFTVGLDLDTRAYFIAATVGIALPTGIKLYSWNARILGNGIRLSLPSIWVFGFICIFTLGGTTGVVLANTVIDIVLHDTLFVVGHFHYVLSIGAVIRIGVGICLWCPVLRGVIPRKTWGVGGFIALFIGVNTLFLPTHFVGLRGGPRRYGYLPDFFTKWLKISTFGRSFAFNGLCCILFRFFLGFIQLRVIINVNRSGRTDMNTRGNTCRKGTSQELSRFMPL